MTWNVRQIGPIKAGLPAPSSPFSACAPDLVVTAYEFFNFKSVKIPGYEVDCASDPTEYVEDFNGTKLCSASDTDCQAMLCYQGQPDADNRTSGVAGLLNVSLLNATIDYNHPAVTKQCMTSAHISAMVSASFIIAFIG
jgi:hypothetical protein